MYIHCFIYMKFICRINSQKRNAGSKGKCIWNSDNDCQVVLCRGCTILHSHQQHMRVPIFLPCQKSVLLNFWGFANLIGENCYFSVVSLDFISYYEWNWVSFHMYEGCLYIFFLYRIYLWSFGSFSSQFLGALYILKRCVLSDTRHRYCF